MREFLILRAVAEKEKIEITDDQIEKETNPEESESSLRDRLKNRKAMELILDRADITEKKPQKNSETEADKEDRPDSSWSWIQVEEEKRETCDETAGKGKS